MELLSTFDMHLLAKVVDLSPFFQNFLIEAEISISSQEWGQ